MNELHIDIGVDESDKFEYEEEGRIVFHIPHYKVLVNLKRGTSKNITPTLNYTIGAKPYPYLQLPRKD